MSQTTAIEWCDSTLNVQMGCDGCELWNAKAGLKHCYAGTLTERYAGKNAGFPAVFEQPRLFVERLDQALRWRDLTGMERPGKPWLNGLPRLIFTCDMGDPFTESLPLHWLAPLLPRMADSPHQWLLLTKRPRRMRLFFEAHECPKNVWVGVSVTDQVTAVRVSELLKIRAHVRFVSAEPLLGPVDLTNIEVRVKDLAEIKRVNETIWPPLDWVIVGGESGPGARPMHPDWARSLRNQCQTGRVPYFFKQWGEWASAGCEAFGKTGGEVRVIDSVGRALSPPPQDENADALTMVRVGKHRAGRLLDGREWNEMPGVPA